MSSRSIYSAVSLHPSQLNPITYVHTKVCIRNVLIVSSLLEVDMTNTILADIVIVCDPECRIRDDTLH